MYTLLSFYQLFPVSVWFFIVFDKKGNMVVWFSDWGFFGIEDRYNSKNKRLTMLDYSIELVLTQEIEIPWEQHDRIYKTVISHNNLKDLRAAVLRVAKSRYSNPEHQKSFFNDNWIEA